MDAWHDVGSLTPEWAGIGFFNLIPEPSELALPDLLRKQPESFNLIFIDGWHTFDQMMLDMFYANRLVRIGGYIIIDDCNWGVSGSGTLLLHELPGMRVAKRASDGRTDEA